MITMGRLLMAVMTVGALAACSFGGDAKDEGDKATGEKKSSSALPGVLQSQWMARKLPIRVDLVSVDRTSEKAVTARIKVNNFSEEEYRVGDDLSYIDQGTAQDATNLTLVDAPARKRYYSWIASDGKCVCSIFPDGNPIQPKQSQEFWASFPVPPKKKITVMVANTPPFMAVPIGDKRGPIKFPPNQDRRDIEQLQLGEPKILPLSGLTVADDKSREEVEDDENVEVRLSSDVLFKLNKADLTPKARTALEDLAKRIDESKATTVKVDGYTDDSGNDAINNPLSQRRAKAVRDELAKLVTKPGVTYQVAGHGSADPVAPNTTEENRQRNRRVSVTFAR